MLEELMYVSVNKFKITVEELQIIKVHLRSYYVNYTFFMSHMQIIRNAIAIIVAETERGFSYVASIQS